MQKDRFLVPLRTRLGLSQADMAERMGLSLRPYQDLESEVRKVRSRHVRLAESVALDVAIEKEEPELAPANVREKALTFVRMILKQNIRQKSSKLLDILLD